MMMGLKKSLCFVLGGLSLSLVVGCGSAYESWSGEADCSGEEDDIELLLTDSDNSLFGIDNGSMVVYFPVEDLEEDGDEVTFESGGLEFELEREGDTLKGDAKVESGDGTTSTCDIELERD